MSTPTDTRHDTTMPTAAAPWAAPDAAPPAVRPGPPGVGLIVVGLGWLALAGLILAIGVPLVGGVLSAFAR